LILDFFTSHLNPAYNNTSINITRAIAAQVAPGDSYHLHPFTFLVCGMYGDDVAARESGTETVFNLEALYLNDLTWRCVNRLFIPLAFTVVLVYDFVIKANPSA
jgi:hypothetical protein